MGARYRRRLADRLDRIYVWEVELDNPEVDVNRHNRWNTAPEHIENVMAASGRFVRLVDEISLTDYRAAVRSRVQLVLA